MKQLISVFLLLLLSCSGFAQIPNGNFETWDTTSGWNNPTGWDNINAFTHSSAIYTCEKGTPGYSGASYLKLTSKTVGSSVVPGVATCGILGLSYTIADGFPFSSRPVGLAGAWQYMGFSGDRGKICVMLSKWNAAASVRDTVAFSALTLTGMVMSWATFSIPFSYFSGAVPDSAYILLAASGSSPAANSYLYVDSLSFYGLVPAKTDIHADKEHLVSIFPNPNNTGYFNIDISGSTEEEGNICVSDLFGNILLNRMQPLHFGNNSINLNLSHLSTGCYLFTLNTPNYRIVKTIVVER